MNIYAKENDKVVFTGQGGYAGDYKTAHKHLEIDKVYTVEYTEVGGWRTNVYLKEITDVAFNSVMFEDYAELELYEHWLVKDGVAIKTHKVSMDEEDFWFEDGTYFPKRELDKIYFSEEGKAKFVSLHKDRKRFRNSLLSMIADIELGWEDDE